MNSPNEPRFYIGIYESDDMRSQKSCKTVLVFGEQTQPKVHDSDPEFRWKWVSLPCPHCNIVHSFKRSAWVDRGLVQEGPNE